MVFRNGDLSEIPGAAELIDSAQDAAKKLARCCAAKDAEIAELNATVERYQHQVLDQHEEIARLREAIKEWDRANGESVVASISYDLPIEEVEQAHARLGEASEVLSKIAREGR